MLSHPSKTMLKMFTCSLPLQIRIATKLIEEEDAGSGSPMFDFVESCLRHKNEMVIYEAAQAIVQLKNTTTKDLAPAVSVLQLFCSSPKPTLRFAAVRTLNKVSFKIHNFNFVWVSVVLAKSQVVWIDFVSLY
jgi:hypothetical protein